MVHFFASNSFKTPVEAALVDLLKRLGGYYSTSVRCSGLVAPLALARPAAVPQLMAWQKLGRIELRN